MSRTFTAIAGLAALIALSASAATADENPYSGSQHGRMTEFGPNCDIGRIKIPQCSDLVPKPTVPLQSPLGRLE